MSARPAKRPRYTTDLGEEEPSTPTFDLDYISTCIENLDKKTLQSLLLTAAKHDDHICTAIQNETGRRVQAERAKVLDFDYLSKSAWKSINRTYSGMSGSRQYDMAGEVQAQVQDCIQTIRKGCSGYASFGTKKNGLETLRKIGKTICLSGGDVMGHEVQKDFQGESVLEEAMLEIVEGMVPVEVDELVLGGEPAGEWFGKVVELERLAEGYGLFEGLGDLIRLLNGSEEDEGDGEEGSGEEGEEISDDAEEDE